MPNSTINATVNGLNSTAGNVATLDLQVGNSTVASITSTGVAVTGSISATGSTTFPGAGINWQSVQTGNFTAVAGRGYPVNTTSASITVTLPATPSVGDVVWLVDYAGTWDTNTVLVARNGSNILGSAANYILAQDREGIGLVYVDATQGWIPYSGFNAVTPVNTITVDYLVIAGGGAGSGIIGGGGGAGGYRTSAGTSGGGAAAESALTLNQATNYTVTVGAGAAIPANSATSDGSNSVFATITSTGGGGGGYYGSPSGVAGNTGGSGGAGGVAENGTPGAAGSGTANQGYAAGASGNRGGTGLYPGAGGGGGAGAVGNANTGGKGGTGGVGGAGVASTITGSSVTRGGGGGGSGYSGTGGAGGSGGGGAGASGEFGNATNGTANTGGGGGGRGGTTATGGAGGSGVVILRYPSYFTISNPGGGLTYTTSTSAGLTVATFTAGTGNVQWN